MLYGWLGPNGEFYECAHMEHYNVAEKLVSGYSGNKPADEFLVENMGWIKIYHSYFDKFTRLYTPHRITEIQKNIIRNNFFDFPQYWDKAETIRLKELDIIETL